MKGQLIECHLNQQDYQENSSIAIISNKYLNTFEGNFTPTTQRIFLPSLWHKTISTIHKKRTKEEL